MNSPSDLDRLAEHAGVEPEYWDIWGNHHPISDASKRKILGLLGFPASTDADTATSLRASEEEGWRRMLPPVLAIRESDPCIVPLVLSDDAIGNILTLRLTEEEGRSRTIEVPTGELEVGAKRQVDGRHLVKLHVPIPGVLPIGYHKLSGNGGGEGSSMRLIVAPDRSYLPEQLENGGKLWGISTQLYALRRDDSWGIGDFQDLHELVTAAGDLGASLVGLNPLHTLFSHDPERASPYQPSSRLYVNPLYIDIKTIPEFSSSAKAQAKLEELDAAVGKSRIGASVPYTEVTKLKWSALETLFEVFRTKHLKTGDTRAAEFQTYCEREGMALQRFALFEALAEKFNPKPWQEWPAEYQAPDKAAVAEFAKKNKDRVIFQCYLQWIADEQLTSASNGETGSPLAIGLYRDLAIGSSYDGSDAWGNQNIYALGASTGCPPDPFNMLGQDWEIPPFNPHALRRTGYDPFIAVIRANMRHAGALRIDHVMGLMHLFWVPKGDTPANGAYVTYPFEDLLAIVALESHRNRCVVIGEDLGTVPAGFRERMADANMLSYRVLYFEKDGDRFKSPGEYPNLALACVTTHDLATLEGFWQDLDIDMKRDLSLYPSADAETNERQGRQHDRYLLLRALENSGLLPENRDPNDADAIGMDSMLNVAIHQFVAQSPASIVLVQIDDLMRESEQINVPGTVDERPNWRRRLSHSTKDLAQLPLVKALQIALNDRSNVAQS